MNYDSVGVGVGVGGGDMRFILRGKAIDLTISDVYKVAKKVSPEVIVKHFVDVDGKKIPPKQLLHQALLMKGIEMARIDFTTMDARSIFRRLGLKCGEM